MIEGFQLRSELHDGVKVFVQAVRLSGGEGEIVELRDGDQVIGRYCSCNGVRMECPPPQSPVCDCTTNPPTLSCQ
jgi:hypothetical protein